MKAGQIITEGQATEFLKKDLANAEDVLNTRAKLTLEQNQFDALVSFIFNVGGGAFMRSSLLACLKCNDYIGVTGAFLLYCKVHDPATNKLIISNGLLARRKAERVIFLGII